MSVYTWGSAIDSALGYPVGHSKNTIEIPRRIQGLGDIATVGAGKAYSFALTRNAELYRWGNGFSIIPRLVKTEAPIGKIACNFYTGDALFLERDTGGVYELNTADETRPVAIGGRLVYASDISCLASSVHAPSRWLIVDRKTGCLLEYAASHDTPPVFSPSTLFQLSPASRVWSSPSGQVAVQMHATKEIWILNTRAHNAPRRIMVHSPTFTDAKWAMATNKCFMSDVVELALPLTSTCRFAYAIIHGGDHVVEFHLDSHTAVFTGRCLHLHDVGLFESLSLTRSALLLVGRDGGLVEVPVNPNGAQVDMAKTVLHQVVSVAASENHFVALTKINSYIEPESKQTSLERICTRVIMAKKVNLENVADLLLSLLERGVVDLPVLLDSAYSFYRMNRLLLKIVGKEKADELESRADVMQAMDLCKKGGVSFSGGLIRARRSLEFDRLLREQPASLKPIPRMGTIRARFRPLTSPDKGSVVHPIISSPPSPLLPEIMTPSPAVESSQNSDETLLTAFDLDEFVPLDVSAGASRRKHVSSGSKRVSKWSKPDIPRGASLAPWSSPASPITSSPVLHSLSSLMCEQAPAQPRENRLREVSRWYVGEGLHSCSVEEVIRREQEERDIAEAVRLVEDYERALAEHARYESRNAGKHASSKSDVSHSSRSRRYRP